MKLVTNSFFFVSDSPLSKAILKAGGKSFEEECKKKGSKADDKCFVSMKRCLGFETVNPVRCLFVPISYN